MDEILERAVQGHWSVDISRHTLVYWAQTQTDARLIRCATWITRNCLMSKGIWFAVCNNSPNMAQLGVTALIAGNVCARARWSWMHRSVSDDYAISMKWLCFTDYFNEVHMEWNRSRVV